MNRALREPQIEQPGRDHHDDGNPERQPQEEAQNAARLAALAMIASLQRELGDLDRISAWLRIFGMVNCAPDFELQPKVIDGASDLLYELFGPEYGCHARSAVGMGSLPHCIPVEINGEFELWS